MCTVQGLFALHTSHTYICSLADARHSGWWTFQQTRLKAQYFPEGCDCWPEWKIAGKMSSLDKKKLCGAENFPLGALAPSQYGCIPHNSRWDFQQYLGFENPPYPFRDSVFPFWWDATFCRFPSFKLQDRRVCFCQTCSFHILISVLGVGLFFAKSKERRYFHIEFQCPESSTNLIFINSFNGHKCSDLMP